MCFLSPENLSVWSFFFAKAFLKKQNHHTIFWSLNNILHTTLLYKKLQTLTIMIIWEAQNLFCGEKRREPSLLLIEKDAQIETWPQCPWDSNQHSSCWVSKTWEQWMQPRTLPCGVPISNTMQLQCDCSNSQPVWLELQDCERLSICIMLWSPLFHYRFPSTKCFLNMGKCSEVVQLTRIKIS